MREAVNVDTVKGIARGAAEKSVEQLDSPLLVSVMADIKVEVLNGLR